MAQKGKKTDDKTISEAMAMLAVCNNMAEVARKFNVSRSTIIYWRRQYDKEAEAKGELNIEQLRAQNKKEFTARAWKNIGQVQSILERRLGRALDDEDVLDQIVEEVENLKREDLTDEQRISFYKRINAIKVENVRELAILLGTLFDKQALANKEETNIIGVKKLEDFEDDD